MADTDYNEWVLLDTDLTTRLAILPVISSHLLLEINEPGSGELKIPLDSTAAGQITSGMFCECYYRGASRGGFFVDNLKEVEADSNEGAGRVLSVSGRGALALLNDAIIWDDGSGSTTRTWAAATKASILIDMIDEAQARGALANLTYDFSDTDDSASAAWTDSEEYKFNVGMSLLDLLRELAKTGTEFAINLSGGNFVLSAYLGGIGSDKSESVFLRIGSNCLEVSDDYRGDELVNVLRTKFKDGYITVSDGTSITNYRRREQLLSLEQAQSGTTASTYAAAKLDAQKDPRRSISIRVHDGVSPNLFLDYVMGDTVTVDMLGTEVSYRVLGIQADFDSDGYSNVVLELNNILYENQLRIENELNWIINQWNTARDTDQLEAVLWTQIGTLAASDNVYDMLISGGYLYVAWYEDTPQSICNVARFHLANRVWETIGNGNYPQGVKALGDVGGTIYAVGQNADGTEEHVWVLSGTTWTSIGEIVDSSNEPVLTSDGTNLYYGDLEDVTVDGVVCGHCVGMWDGATWTSVGSSAGGTYLLSLVYWNGTLYGGFVDGLRAYLGGGSWSSPLAGISTGQFFDLAGTTDYLYIAYKNLLYQWDGVAANATLIATCTSGYSGNAIYTLKTNLSDVYIGGMFTGFVGVGLQLNGVAKYSGGQFYQFEGGVGETGLGQVFAIELDGDDLYFGGSITGANGSYSGTTYTPGVTTNALAGRIFGFENALDFASRYNSFDLASAIHNATASSLTDNDEFVFWEDVTQAIRKITWANIKSTLKTYFDTLYVALTGNQSIAGDKTFTGTLNAIPSAADATAIYAETVGDAYGMDLEQSTSDTNQTSSTLFLYRLTNGAGNITAPMIEGLQNATGSGTITGDFIRLDDSATSKFFEVDKDGNVATSGVFTPASFSDTDTPNNSIYYSTTQSKLVYKDGGGTVNGLY